MPHAQAMTNAIFALHTAKSQCYVRNAHANLANSNAIPNSNAMFAMLFAQCTMHNVIPNARHNVIPNARHTSHGRRMLKHPEAPDGGQRAGHLS